MDIMSYIDQGGVIMYILLVLNILGFTIMAFKFLQFLFVKREKIVSKIFDDLKVNEKESMINIAKDTVTQKVLHYEGGLSTVKIIASIAPLLGLLGTVIGVLMAFEAISKQGLDDPTVFAGGISLALITTVGGLIVAIPHYVGYNYLISMLDHLEANLNKEVSLKIYESKS